MARQLAGRLHMQVGFAPIYSLDPVATGESRRQYGVAGMVVQAKGTRVHVYVTHLDYRADPALRIDYVAVSPGV